MLNYILPIIVLIILFVPIVILFLNDKRKKTKQITNLKNKKNQIRIIFIDKFYYNTIDYYIYYALVQDVDNKKKYAIKTDYSLYKKDIIYGDNGSLWIDKKMKNDHIKNGILQETKYIKSDSQTFDPSMLKNITFIEGYIEFDKYKKE